MQYIKNAVHWLYFPYQEWQHGYREEREIELLKERENLNMKDTLAFRDFIRDIHGIIFASYS